MLHRVRLKHLQGISIGTGWHEAQESRRPFRSASCCSNAKPREDFTLAEHSNCAAPTKRIHQNWHGTATTDCSCSCVVCVCVCVCATLKIHKKCTNQDILDCKSWPDQDRLVTPSQSQEKQLVDNQCHQQYNQIKIIVNIPEHIALQLLLIIWLACKCEYQICTRRCNWSDSSDTSRIYGHVRLIFGFYLWEIKTLSQSGSSTTKTRAAVARTAISQTQQLKIGFHRKLVSMPTNVQLMGDCSGFATQSISFIAHNRKDQ